MFNRVLVVCIGNICRSPVAEGLLRVALPQLQFSSAGLGTNDGRPADPMMVQLLQEANSPAAELVVAHRSRQLQSWMATSADVVLVMETSHKQQMERQYPHLRGRVFRLLETQKADIPDPYKQPRAAFEAALSQIETGVQDWQRKFAALAGTKVK